MSRRTYGILGVICVGMILAFIAMASDKETYIFKVITTVPLLVILALLFMRVNMLVAALVGGIMAVIIGKIGLGTANQTFLTEIPKMLTIIVPIINSAVATAVFRAGGYTSALILVRRGIGERVAFVGAFIVILQALATYMSGIGGGSAMVIAPLAFAAVGVVPEVIAGMSIAAAVSFTTSPASLESGIVSTMTGIPVAEYVTTMRPYWLVFCAIAIAVAFIGCIKRGTVFQSEESEEYKSLNTGELVKRTIPAVFLLVAVVAGPIVNKALGAPVLGPLVYTVVTTALIFLCSKFTLDQSVDAVIDGSTYILTRLLQVGMFFSFIALIGNNGAFEVITSVVRDVPISIMVPIAVLCGFLIGIPAGAYVGMLLALVLPIAIELNFPLVAVGFITMGVGFGSQMSLVNITMMALSSGFKIPITRVAKGNTPYIIGCMALLLIIAFFVGV